MMLSFLLQIRTKVFDSWFTQAINMILESGLVVLAILNIIFDFVLLSPQLAYKLGLYFCIYFMALQIVCTLISFASILYSCCSGLVACINRRRRKRVEQDKTAAPDIDPEKDEKS